jgi:hypothetical protein
MSRRLAHRPRHHFMRITPRPLRSSRQDYLRQRWIYRQQRPAFAKRQPGYGLALLPYGWRLVRETIRLRA